MRNLGGTYTLCYRKCFKKSKDDADAGGKCKKRSRKRKVSRQ